MRLKYTSGFIRTKNEKDYKHNAGAAKADEFKSQLSIQNAMNDNRSSSTTTHLTHSSAERLANLFRRCQENLCISIATNELPFCRSSFCERCCGRMWVEIRRHQECEIKWVSVSSSVRVYELDLMQFNVHSLYCSCFWHWSEHFNGHKAKSMNNRNVRHHQFSIFCTFQTHETGENIKRIPFRLWLFRMKFIFDKI